MHSVLNMLFIFTGWSVMHSKEWTTFRVYFHNSWNDSAEKLIGSAKPNFIFYHDAIRTLIETVLPGNIWITYAVIFSWLFSKSSIDLNNSEKLPCMKHLFKNFSSTSFNNKLIRNLNLQIYFRMILYLSKPTTSSSLKFFVPISSDIAPNALNDFYKNGHTIP